MRITEITLKLPIELMDHRGQARVSNKLLHKQRKGDGGQAASAALKKAASGALAAAAFKKAGSRAALPEHAGVSVDATEEEETPQGRRPSLSSPKGRRPSFSLTTAITKTSSSMNVIIGYFGGCSF